MHNHDKCKHELEYCDICDVVYCEKCQREWYGNTFITSGTNIIWTSEPSFTHAYCNHN